MLLRIVHEIGIDLSGYKSKPISRDLLNNADLIVCMSEGHCQVINTAGYSSVVLGQGIADPYGLSIEVYRDCRDTLINAMTGLVELL